MLILALLTVLIVTADRQDKKDDERPRKGDVVVMRGCLGGGVIETIEVASEDGSKRHVAPLSFRLTGNKKLLKTLKDEHSNHSDTLKGVLKTELPDQRRGVGTRIGNTRIGVGMVDPHASNQRALPVLEVKEFEHSDVRCR